MSCQSLHRASLSHSCRRGVPRRHLLEACRALAAPLAAILAFTMPFAAAAPVTTAVKFTGMGYPIGTGGADSNWQVVALPVDSTYQASTPYAAWVFSGTGASGTEINVPTPWFGGPTNAGLPGYGRWIGLQQDNAISVLPNSGPHPMDYYTTIYESTFESTEAGSAFLWFRATADNAVTFFVNGTLTDTGTNKPTITNGSQVAARVQGLSTLKTISGTVTVKAGTNKLYAVVEDLWNPSSHNFGLTGLIVVPEPSTLSSGAVAGAGLGITAIGRRLRRRPHA